MEDVSNNDLLSRTKILVFPNQNSSTDCLTAFPCDSYTFMEKYALVV